MKGKSIFATNQNQFDHRKKRKKKKERKKKKGQF